MHKTESLRDCQQSTSLAGRVNVTRKQAFEALLTFEMDFEGPHFMELSEGARDLIKSLLQVCIGSATVWYRDVHLISRSEHLHATSDCNPAVCCRKTRPSGPRRQKPSSTIGSRCVETS